MTEWMNEWKIENEGMLCLSIHGLETVGDPLALVFDTKKLAGEIWKGSPILSLYCTFVAVRQEIREGVVLEVFHQMR